MKYLSDGEETLGNKYIEKAAEIARRATCERSKCGCVIVKNDEIIGSGFNSPAGRNEEQRRCTFQKDLYHPKVTDKTCCMHAEQRAIMDALRRNSEKIVGSRLYFIRLDDVESPSWAGEPYCTVCSKMALDTGIAEFVLWHERGLVIYNTGEYNLLSYKFQG